MLFFFVFGFQILANIYFALGFFGTGAWYGGYSLRNVQDMYWPGLHAWRHSICI